MTKAEQAEHDWRVKKSLEEIAETKAMLHSELDSLEKKITQAREWIKSAHVPFRDEQLSIESFNVDTGLFILRARIDAMERFK